MATSKKKKVEWVCSECGGTTLKWAGRCPHCGEWNTLQEFTVETGAAARYSDSRHRGLVAASKVLDLNDVQAQEVPRIVTGFSEFDRVMGGGLVPGGVSLLGGDPGIGKSTLLLQVMNRLVQLGVGSLYVSGEESPGQIAMRAKRLGIDPKGMRLMSEIQLENIESTLLSEKPQFVVIDSIQTLFSNQLDVGS